MSSMTSGKLAKAVGINTQTLRYYERRGLLPEPPRRDSGYRLYPPESVDRLLFIKRAQSLGFTLEEIGRLLTLRVSDTATAKDIRHEVEEKLIQIEAKIAALNEMHSALTHLVEQCHGEGPTSDCPILDALSDTDITS